MFGFNREKIKRKLIKIYIQKISIINPITSKNKKILHNRKKSC